MKRVLFLLTISFLLIAVNNSGAQKVTYDDDTIKVDKKPYAIMKKKNIGCCG